jgi:hypothetical protein
MAKPGIDLGGGAAENTVALNPMLGVAREAQAYEEIR